MAFDAYAQWLKIPEDRRPPTHYDLLGLPPFEASSDRIQASAMDRMGHVRRYQLGQHSDAAIQLLKEISLAYDTLITPARKAAYDRRLSGMDTVDKVVGLETLVAEPRVPPVPPITASPPPVQVSAGYVLAAVVAEPPPIPTSPFQPGFDPTAPLGPPPRKRRSRSITLRGAARTSWRITAWSAKTSFWTVRLADRGMCRSLGDDNTILHNFFRGVILAVVLAVLGTTPWWMPGVWARWKPEWGTDKIAVQPETPYPMPAPDPALATEIAPPPIDPAAPEPFIPPQGIPTVIGGAPQAAPAPPTAAAPPSTPGVPLYPTGYVHNSIDMSFAQVPAGEFDMGSSAGRTASEAQHRVRISRPFYLGMHEVTQAQFQAVMGSNPSQFTQLIRGAMLSGVDTSRLPVDNVLFSEAVEFCQRLGARVQEQAAGRRYRLPTEAEWEYACRAGTKTEFNVGDQLQSYHANFKAPGLSDLTLRTMVVGSYGPNSLGLCDMHGNVEEWCSDYYDWMYYRTSPRDDPPGPASGFNRVVRGGSYIDRADDCRSARRIGRYPASRVIVCGFRVVCELK